ncbi:MAG: hypothetical protein IJT77_06905 [Clostridia bacterium]|nr:hypothetical protein [Clostridia bacterium]
MNHYFTYLLRQLMERKKIVSIYADEQHPEEFLVGYLEKVDAQHYLICEFTPWGEVDAYRIRRMQDVSGVLYGEEYEERIGLMLKLKDRKIRRVLPRDAQCEDGVLVTVLQQCRERREIVSLIINQEIYCGRVRECNGLYVTMELFDFFGRVEGDQIFELRSIDILQLRSGEEQMYKCLEEHQAEIDKTEAEEPSYEDHHPDDVP